MEEEVDMVGVDNTDSVVLECDQSSTFIVTTTGEGELVNLTEALSSVQNAQDDNNSYVVITTDENEIMSHGFYESEFLEEVVLNPEGILSSIEATTTDQQAQAAPTEVELRENENLVDSSTSDNCFINIGNLVTEFRASQKAVVPNERVSVAELKNSPKKRKLSGKQAAQDKPVNYVTPVQIPNGLLLFISEATTASGGGQVVAMATKSDAMGKTGCRNVKKMPTASTSLSTQSKNLGPSHQVTGKSTSQPLPKPTQTKGLSSKRSSYEVCFMSNNAIRSVPLMETNCTLTTFACELCEEDDKCVQFCQFNLLSRHYLKAHQKQLIRKASVACKEEGCNFKSWKVDQLRHHLSLTHGYEMKIHKIVFSTMDEFREWKEKEERRTGNQYVRSSGNHPARQGDCTYVYYICRRSGNYRQEDDSAAVSKKGRKSFTSDKINGRCTSTITLTQLHDKQTINCEYWPFHYGHDDQVRHRTLSKQEKKWMLLLIERGWNTDEILKTLRDATIPGTTERMRKAVRQDLANIVRSQGCRSFERRDVDDAASVKLWIQELHNKGAVVINKIPLSKSAEEQGHFLLMAMDDHQAELAQLHADNHVLQILHLPVPLNKNYHLICLTTVSKAGAQGYLLSYALTDRYNPETLRAILTAFQTKTGGIQPQLIVSEDPAVASLVWPAADGSEVSEETSTAIPALIPWWKVQREWDESAVKWIRDENQRYAVKKFLDLLLSESDPNKFAATLQFLTVMLRSDSGLSQFAQYFAEKWTNRVEYWAKFHSVPFECASFVQLEKEMDLIAQRARHVKRLDKCIYSLDYISRNQPFYPITEFRAENDKAESLADQQDVEVLRLKISDDLKHLDETVRSIGDVSTLREISKVLSETIVAATNSDAK